MKSIRFLVVGCLVFILVGPPLPLLFMGLHAAVAERAPQKVGAAFQVAVYFSVFAYWLGGFIAAGVGALFTVTSLVVARGFGRYLKMQGRVSW